MVPTFNAIELPDTLLLAIDKQVEFQANDLKDHEKTKALVGGLGV